MALREQLQLGPREVVCLVGAGGKSTLLEALAREYEQAGKRVIVTTTTKIMPPAPRAAEPGCLRFGQGGEGAEQGPGRPLVLGDTVAEVAAGIERLGVTRGGRSPVVGTRVLASGKLDGIPTDWIPALRDLSGIEAVLIEADGAARLPLKAPAAYEPVLPESATLVIAMCGLEAQWVPLDEEHVHRASLLADLLDLEPGRPIPPEALLRALVLGYHDSVPLHARLVCLFNKADAYPPDAILMEAAHRAPVGVWMGAVGSEEGPIVECLRHMERRPAAVVLAAGLSRRMGGCAKVTLELDGVTFVGRAVRAALGGGAQPPVLVVAGREAEAVRAALGRDVPPAPNGGDRWRILVNPHPEKGIGGSLALGADHAGGRDLIVLLADQPFVTADTIRRLLAVWERNPAVAAAALETPGGTWGPPVVINRSLLPAIGSLTGDQGARAVLQDMGDRVLRVQAVGDEGLDVDCVEDLARARARGMSDH